MRVTVLTTTVISLLFASVTALGASRDEYQSEGFEQVKQPQNQLLALDPVQLETLRGGLAPLGVALGIAGLDMALMGFYWGVYVPYYAPQEPSYDLP
jgi:hypothetical protein